MLFSSKRLDLNKIGSLAEDFGSNSLKKNEFSKLTKIG